MTVFLVIVYGLLGAFAVVGFVKNWSADRVFGRRGIWWFVGVTALYVVLQRLPAAVA